MAPPVSQTPVRVRYAETDQMGYAHHANYLVWCEVGRTHHMREQGVPYRALEEAGIRLPVVEARLRFRRPARYDDELTVRSWVRECGSRMVEFGNAIERTDDRELLATAAIRLAAIGADGRSSRIPDELRRYLVPADDPVRL